jgi:2,4-dienoyl-CoA reductase-like NADH-dependent reductase (Old Yellow Enzyme family)
VDLKFLRPSGIVPPDLANFGIGTLTLDGDDSTFGRPGAMQRGMVEVATVRVGGGLRNFNIYNIFDHHSWVLRRASGTGAGPSGAEALAAETLTFMAPGRIGRVALKNRLVRAATSETMATADGGATADLVRLYADLARGGAGLIITGHIYVEPRGQYEPRQLGLDRDSRIGPLARVTDAVHRHDGVIFAELSHAGSQSLIADIVPLAPSVVPNAISARPPVEMSDADVEKVIADFAAAAERAKRAGFDGIHLHSGNGYLLAQFNSPFTNRRDDRWGGDRQRRARLLVEVLRAVRRATGADFPITARLGMADTVPGGLTLEDGVAMARQLAAEGLDGLEVTYGVMTSYRENIRPYAGVGPRQALADGMLHRSFARPVPEAYYRPFARAAKAAIDIPVILVGGIRSTQIMDDIIRAGDADFLAMARPFVREPDLVNKIARGRRGPVDCVSCNICFLHEGIDPLRCWRTPSAILAHIYKHHLQHAIGI